MMERESFEDEATAALMNEYFVCIKVDREERPDVDRIYMEACQAISGSGGWPLNAFLLPDARPFYAGTYYPPVAKYNRPSWKDVLLSLSSSYREKRDEVTEQAERLTKNIAGGGLKMLRIEPEASDHTAWRTAVMGKLKDGLDPSNGGFGGAPKFPMSQSLEAMVANAVLHGEGVHAYDAGQSALAMLNGGIYDHLGGGFSRYTVDAAWRVPHFEKMLYDNALLLRLLAKLEMTQPNPRYRKAIAETTAWLQREMLLPSGAYRAALDADSEGIEGKYFVWQLEEIEGLLPEDQAKLIAEFYNITEAGNWEEEHTNIPYRTDSLKVVADRLGLPLDVAEAKLKAARKKLHDYRFTTRIHPGEDDKVILQWNALLVSAWTWCYRALNDGQYLQLAEELNTKLTDLLHQNGDWHRNSTGGQLGAPAFLDDLAALAEARLDLFDVTSDLPHLSTELVGGAVVEAGSSDRSNGDGAKELLNRIARDFGNEDSPMYNLRAAGASELPVVSVDLFDNALPSGNSQTMHGFLRLSRLMDDPEYLQRGENMLAAMAGSLERYPSSFGGWVHAALLHAGADRELVIVGPGAAAAAKQFLSRYRPGLLVAATETANDDLPLFRNRYLTGELRFYVCENRACRAPVSTVNEALLLLDGPPADTTT
ncbi:hypothetical protein GGR27_001950 [Lewinella antarctica]|uniref:Spermatogenesis-associated protein 20-like TRX domain-containing protein n=1 Tax=Neolewinella antarctica TaxID=442734 RepID=A0ABX0XBV6_9BACT|nr:hypothetical protein [Neolewinella antarctica]